MFYFKDERLFMEGYIKSSSFLITEVISQNVCSLFICFSFRNNNKEQSEIGLSTVGGFFID